MSSHLEGFWFKNTLGERPIWFILYTPKQFTYSFSKKYVFCSVIQPLQVEQESFLENARILLRLILWTNKRQQKSTNTNHIWLQFKSKQQVI